MENIKRLDYLDYAKGIGILLVVLAHIYCFNPDINRELLVIWIYSFHMPLFFIISGMLLKYKNENDIKKVIISRIKGLLIPYLFFSLLSIIVKIIINGFDKNMVIWDLIYSAIGIGIDVLWFLPALFIGEILFVLINKMIKNNYAKVLLIAFLFIGSTFISKENGLILLLISRGLIALGFVAIGYLGFEFVHNRDINLVILITLFIIHIITSRMNGFVDLNNLVFNNKLLYIFNSILGSFILIELCKLIKSNILVYLGKNSLIIMAIHLNLIYLFRKYIGLNLYGYISGLMLFLLIILIEIPIIYVINKYLPFMIGKFPKKKKVQVMSD